MKKVTIHQYERGKHPGCGKYRHYEVVSGPNPFGPRGGRGGKWVDGELRKHCWSRSDAHEYALYLAATECLEFIDPWEFELESLHNKATPPRETAELESKDEPFDPSAVVDTRRKQLIEAASRPDQQRFREQVLNAYSFICSATGCKVKEALDAAHIHPYLGAATNHICNGLPLRSDIHKLFDRFLIAVDENYTVRVSKTILDTEYGLFDGKRLHLPSEERYLPSKKALRLHHIEFCRLECNSK